MTLVALGKRTLTEAARELSVSVDLVRHHLKECMKRVKEPERQQREERDYPILLNDLLMKLREKIYEIYEMRTTPTNIRMLTLALSEARKLCTDIATLEGRLQQSFVVQFNQLNIQFEKLTSFMITSLCRECREKVQAYLETSS